MDNKLLKPDYIFEVSWEVCNKVGGIHTVISTKALTLNKTFKDHLILIGPDVMREGPANPEFIEDKNLFKSWKNIALEDGIRIRTGRWNIVGQPLVFLIDFSPYISKKNQIFETFWKDFQLDSISGQWDYIEPTTFGYAAGLVIEHFCKYNVTVRDRIIAHFHEWQTGTGVLYLKKYLPHVATLFTSHATTVGRSIAGNGLSLYKNLKDFNGDAISRELGVVAKHSCEKITAINADCFTTVSEITAEESFQLLTKQVDVITPNGFEDDFVPQGDDFDLKRKQAREKILHIAETMFGRKPADNVKLIGTSGRYEFRNKGIDIFIEALEKTRNHADLKTEILAFILVPANNYGARRDLAEKMINQDSTLINEGNNRYLTHGLHDAEYDAILNRLKQLNINNNAEDKVKIIFVPSYLNGDDGIFNISYYDILIGLDLTIFPSYYEPWGYTPLESLAFHVPTITTSLAGFGRWISSMSKDSCKCLKVIDRNDENYEETAEIIANSIIQCSSKNEQEMTDVRKNALEISKTALWENLIEHYYTAYHIALEKLGERFKDLVYSEPIKQITVVETKKYNQPIWRGIQVQPNLSGKFKGLEELSYNLWWSWNYDAIELWEYIGKDGLWKSHRYNPISLLKEVSYERFVELENDNYFLKLYDHVYTKFRQYMDEAVYAKGPQIAYYCMEYGLIDTLKIYSGGLGILAGDYLKEASDSNVNMIAVGLLYKYGYFHQQLSLQGDQLAIDVQQDFRRLPLIPVKDDYGNQLTVQIGLPGRTVTAQIWMVFVGRITLYLMDTDRKDNQEQDRSITYHLYGGDLQNRLRQEMLLGVGGIRMLSKLNIEPKVYHMNEGHAALIGVERMNQLIAKNNFTFAEALEIVRSTSLFTTHTPVPAGHDTFPEDMIMTYMGHYPDRLKISWQQFINLGKVNPDDAKEKFSMSHLAANLCQEINAVSMLHGEVTKEMFKPLWEGYFADELHIGYVTNGVHYPTWAEKEWQELYEKVFDKRFKHDQSNKKYWEDIRNVPDRKIWEIRQNQRNRLFEYINNRLDSSWIQRREDPKFIIQVKKRLNPNALTIGFARRFATYKRGNLLFRNLDQLAQIVNNPERPVQFLFAGKAHPNDGGGQAIIKQIIEISKRPEFIGKILFLENYDMALAKRLVSGVDIWLNTPTRPLEASGTSGMKAIMNGGLHFSVLDGWWVEGYKPEAGWALDQEQVYEDHEFQNELDVATIYRLLENDIIPRFYERDKNDVPTGWVKYIKNSIAQIVPEFTMKRMIDEYMEKFYSKLAKRGEEIGKNEYELAQKIASWKKKVSRSWDSIEILSVNFHEVVKDPLYMGEKYFGEIALDLKELWDVPIGVEMILSETKLNGSVNIIDIKELKLERIEKQKAYYAIEMVPLRPGNFNFGFRIYPKNEALPHRQDFAYVKWV